MNLFLQSTSTSWAGLVPEGLLLARFNPTNREYYTYTLNNRLIAILLGRLRFSVPEAIEVYRTLAKDIFSKRKMLGKDGAFKASSLERAIKKVLVGKLGEGKAEEKMFEVGEEGVCKT